MHATYCQLPGNVYSIMKRASTLSLDTRNDLQLTTAGVGYVVKTTPEFPPQEFKVRDFAVVHHVL